MNKGVSRISITDFLAALPGAVCLDVRAPGEYAAGHLPGASSFPLFSDAERALVGTAYKQESPQKALELGLLYVGPKMSGFVREAHQLAAGKPILMYCWRGGQRSGAMAWLLAQAGIEVRVLEGGYKAWRQYAHQVFEQTWNIRVVGGYTGSGKTETLQHLQQLGAQVLDLEALARHKGSAFGGMVDDPQPSNEHFINLLAMRLLELDPQQPLWIEDESRMIGSINLPAAFFSQMEAAPCYLLEVSVQRRIKRLLAEYGRAKSEVLQQNFKRIGKKIGGQQVNEALQALADGDLATAASIALRYYDKAYALDLKAKNPAQLHSIVVAQEEARIYAQKLIELTNEAHELT
jgi:tRNA 2-selenouridine synthase